ENNSVAQLLHYAITSDGHLQCCAARLPSNHQYVNVPTQQNHFAQCLQSSLLATSD
nr:hypothetical protein [Tanacetum cinerariifolium]